MVVLGRIVGSGTTRVDQWFLGLSRAVLGYHPRWMLLFTSVRLLVGLLGIAIAVALYRRRWRLAVVVALCPLVSVVAVKLLKPLFGRYKGDTLAYPSGHTTVVTTVTAMLVLAIGVRFWLVAAAVLVSIIGSLGMVANNYHYVTDIVGGALFATAMVCIAVLLAGPQALSRAAARPAARPENTHPPKNVPSSDR